MLRNSQIMLLRDFLRNFLKNVKIHIFYNYSKIFTRFQKYYFT